MAPAKRPAFVVALALLAGRVAAEVYKVTKEDTPPFTLAAKHLFYVDASPASGRGGGRGSGLVREQDEAQVLFEDFRVTMSRLGAKEEAWVLQVGLLPWEDFNALVEPDYFCAGNGEIKLKEHPSKPDAKMMRIPVGKTVTEQMKISKTGVYVVFLSNCGAGENLQISGTISVRGTNGFLPANNQFSLTLFGWCLAANIIAGVVWIALLASNKKDLHEPHYAIASFIAFGVGEAACYWHFLSEMGETGESMVWMEKLCQSMTIMKSAYMFAVVMLLCFGVGLTQAEEHTNISCKLLGVTTLFSAALAPKVCVFDYRHTKNLSDSDIILSTIPAIIVTLASVAWATKGVMKTMTRCKDLNYDGTLKLLQRLVALVVILLILALAVLVAQLSDKPGRGALWWQYHMFWSEVAGELLHFLALVALMVMCKPDQAIFMASAYTASTGEGEMKGVPCAQDDDEEGHLTGGGDEERGPAAEQIGAPAGGAE